jgi:hypothetical protein
MSRQPSAPGPEVALLWLSEQELEQLAVSGLVRRQIVTVLGVEQ